MKKLVTVISVAALVLGACKSFDPFTGEEKYNSTTKGAAIGAGAGAVIGAISGKDAQERRKRALIGAGVGVLAGGAVGVYMDKQEADLRAQMEGTGVSVTRQGDNLILNMPSNITFKSGSADMNASFYKVLDGVGLVLKQYDKTVIEVAGHTDNVGKTDYNQALSERRAGAVAQYLTGKGVKQERVITIGGGENHPIAVNTTDAGRSQNRRVELSLLPLKQ